MKQNKKVIVVDDHDFFRKNMVDLINSFDDIEVIAEATNGKEFLDVLRTTYVDLVIIDVKMPVMDGIEAITVATQNNHRLKCIALTMHKEHDYVMKLITAGAKGILFKGASLEEIEQAIHSVINGKLFYTKEIMDIINLD